jgi:hypothetical protein
MASSGIVAILYVAYLLYYMLIEVVGDLGGLILNIMVALVFGRKQFTIPTVYVVYLFFVMEFMIFSLVLPITIPDVFPILL